jgi:hypothetical protein
MNISLGNVLGKFNKQEMRRWGDGDWRWKCKYDGDGMQKERKNLAAIVLDIMW